MEGAVTQAGFLEYRQGIGQLLDDATKRRHVRPIDRQFGQGAATDQFGDVVRASVDFS